MKKTIIGAAIGGLLALPGVASAHTGTVTCDKTGVVFQYNANFPNTSTVVTETVTNTDTGDYLVQHTTVLRNTAKTDTVTTNTATHITATATYPGGTAVASTTLTCPAKDPTPPVVCTPVTNTVTVEVPGPTQYVDVPGPTQYVDRIVTKTKIVYKTRVKWKTRIKLIPYTPVKQPTKPRAAGVAG